MSDELLSNGRAGDKTASQEKSSTSKIIGKRNHSSIFLMTKHPELFDVHPRPGGYLRRLAGRQNSSRSVAEKNSTKIQKPIATTSNINRIAATGRVDMNSILETSIRCPSARTVSKEDKKNNAVRLCSIAISTVMMLAQHIYKDITSEHVTHTEEYFRELKQADGYPNNVGQLVNLLSSLKKSGKIVGSSYYEDDEDDEENNENKFDINTTITDT